MDTRLEGFVESVEKVCYSLIGDMSKVLLRGGKPLTEKYPFDR